MGLLLYSNALWNGFASDDNWILPSNPVATSGDLAGIESLQARLAKGR